MYDVPVSIDWSTLSFRYTGTGMYIVRCTCTIPTIETERSVTGFVELRPLPLVRVCTRSGSHWLSRLATCLPNKRKRERERSARWRRAEREERRVRSEMTPKPSLGLVFSRVIVYIYRQGDYSLIISIPVPVSVSPLTFHTGMHNYMYIYICTCITRVQGT